MKCTICGELNREESEFCGYCGENLKVKFSFWERYKKRFKHCGFAEKRADKNIKNAFGLAIFQGSLMMVFYFISIFTSFNPISYDAWIWVDIIMILVCALFLYKIKSMTASILLFLRQVISIGFLLSEHSGIVVAIVIAFYYWKGIEGAFKYHKEKVGREKQNELS